MVFLALLVKSEKVIFPDRLRFSALIWPPSMVSRDPEASQITLEPWERFCTGVLRLEKRMGLNT